MPTQAELDKHLRNLRACERCPRMHKPVVVGRSVLSPVLLIGQAPGDKEPVMGRPFAWTAGKTLFKWFHESLGWDEESVRSRFYFAAVCRCFPGKKEAGGDRVPAPEEISACASWLAAEVALLRPSLVLPVGKLAHIQVFGERSLNDTVGTCFPVTFHGVPMDCIPLPHPSGASPWHRMEPGRSLLHRALSLVAQHKAVRSLGAIASAARPNQLDLKLPE